VSLTNVHSLSSDIIDQDRAVALADRRARALGDALRREKTKGHWLFGVVFPFAVAAVGALFGVAAGDELADTAIGRLVLELAQPVIDFLASGSAIHYLNGCAVMVMVGLIAAVRS